MPGAWENLLTMARRRALPYSADLLPVTVFLEPVEFWILGEAAAKADRPMERFIVKETLSFADHILATGPLRHVELARHREEKATEFLDSFRASARKSGPLSDFLPIRPSSDKPDANR